MTQFTSMCEWIRNIFAYLFPPKPVIETWAIVDTLQSTREATVCVVQSFLTGILCVRKRYNANSLHAHNEISTLRTISHTNVVKIENVVYDNEFTDIMLKKYDTDLFSYIRKFSEDPSLFYSSKSIKLRIDWMHGISEGIKHLHTKRIIHCDIKPENILIDRAATIQDPTTGAVLTDFGFATNYTLPDKTVTGMMGSLHYAAPELFRSKVNKGIPLDIFSLGATIWVAVYGLFPWITDTNSGERSEMYKDSDYVVHSDYHANTKTSITNLVKLMTLKQPEKRIPLESVTGILYRISERYAESQLQIIYED